MKKKQQQQWAAIIGQCRDKQGGEGGGLVATVQGCAKSWPVDMENAWPAISIAEMAAETQRDSLPFNRVACRTAEKK
ncbi:hypothetical protein AAC387_Pa03g1745 [Persea americana]